MHLMSAFLFFFFHVSIICACDVDNWLILKLPFWIINYDNDLTLRTLEQGIYISLLMQIKIN